LFGAELGQPIWLLEFRSPLFGNAAWQSGGVGVVSPEASKAGFVPRFSDCHACCHNLVGTENAYDVVDLWIQFLIAW
jgi:hypothetical protein